jgi:hypothetical protein
MTKAPVQINDADYDDGRVVIEAKYYFDRVTGEYDWAVPAWEEMGLGELEGPFASREAAEAALSEAAPFLGDYGFTASKVEA